MAQKDIYSVIEELLEADMTKKDEIENPQAMKEEEEEMEEASTDVTNKTTSDNAAGNHKPKSDNEGDNSSEVLGSEKGAALDAGGDKDVGDMNKGKIASGAGDNSSEVLGSEKGAALDAGGDKDVGSIDGKTAKPSDASAEVEADKDPHNQESDKGLGEGDEMDEEEDAIEESDQDTTVQKNANDEQLPPQDKETLGAEQTTSSEVAADEGPHAQANDDHDTATKANPKQKVAEEDEMEEEDLEEVKGLDRDGDGDHDKDDHALEEGKYAENVMKAAEMYKAEKSCTYEMAAEKYGCSAEEVKACCESMKEEKDMDEEDLEEKMLDDDAFTYKIAQAAMDGESEIELDGKTHKVTMSKDQAAKIVKEMDDKKQVDEEDDMEEEDEEDMMNEEFKQRASVIFETAVNEKASMIREELEADYEIKLAEKTAELNEKVSEYVDYAVQEWMQENALEIRYSLRSEIAENFIRGLKGLFEESYIEIPEEEVSVVDELTEAVESYKEQIEEQTNELSDLRMEILSIRKQEIVDEIAEDLTETQKIRLEKLSESVEAEDIDEFRFKMEELKEGYFDPTSEQPLLGSLTEEVYGGVVIEEDDTSVSQYAKFLSKTVLK